MKIHSYILFLLSLVSSMVQAQPNVNRQAHSHNDYLQDLPFYQAYSQRFASIEADVMLVDDRLLVAHDKHGLDSLRTFERLYARPIAEQMALNGGTPYPEGGSLQLLIDLKTPAATTLPALLKVLEPLRHCFDPKINPSAVKIIVSGSIPSPDQFDHYDQMIFFDGHPAVNYTPQQRTRLGMVSAPFYKFSSWNGLGRMTHQEYDSIKNWIDSIHDLDLPVRFWAAPDTKTAWQTFLNLDVDFINTDHPEALAAFLNTYNRSHFNHAIPYTPYRPSYANDGSKKRPKNIILLIGDGMGLAAMWAGHTLNGGVSNISQMRQIGICNTVSLDNYHTDSAAAATALATGKKTNNRSVGVDDKGNKLENIPEQLSTQGIACGVVTTDLITGATPSGFYAHRGDRGEADAIVSDLKNSPLRFLIGGADHSRPEIEPRWKTIATKAGYQVINDIQSLKTFPKDAKVVCLTDNYHNEKTSMLEESFPVALERLSTSEKGFFLMAEGAKIDSYAHGNDLSGIYAEFRSFDRTVGQALEWADQNGETLVIVLADHETGGIALLDGSYHTPTELLVHFGTTDHTGIPVPVYTYGPSSYLFGGFTDNTRIAQTILNLMQKK